MKRKVDQYDERRFFGLFKSCRDSFDGSPPWRRRARLEFLEKRQMLSATGSALAGDSSLLNAPEASFSYAIATLQTENEIDFTSTSLLQRLSQQENSSSSNHDDNPQYARDVNVSVNCSDDPFFDEYGVYINGDKYVSLSDLRYRLNCSVGEDWTIDTTSLQNSVHSVADAESNADEIDLALTVFGNGCSSSQELQNDGYQLHEGHCSTLDFPGSMADPYSSDYLTVVLPALPVGYRSVISFSGSATLGSDYYVFVPYDSSSLYDGYVHSGSSKTLYIKVGDDRITEADETFTMTMGTPQAEFGVTSSYVFNQISTSVSATIVDNDGWKIGIVAEDDSDTASATISETDSEEINLRVSRIDNGSGHGEDLHYLIDVTISVVGTANSSDYRIYLNNPDSSGTMITPNWAGRFTVRIPENERFATLTVKAQDDSMVERLEETLSLTVVEAKGYPPFISYAVDDSSFDVIIRDDDKLSLNTVQFKDNLNLISDTIGSFGTGWQNEVHWVANCPTQTLPVAYVCDDTMKCCISALGERDLSQTYQVRMKWYFDSATTGGTFTSEWQTIDDFSRVEISLGSSFIDVFESRQAYYDLSSVVEWEFRTTSEVTREETGYMGESVNPLYVTYSSPVVASAPDDSNSSNGANNGFYHSLIHIGCVAASGVVVSSSEIGSQDDLVFQALWNKIASKSIYKVKLEDGVVVNDEILSYYGKEIYSETPGYYDVMNVLSVTCLGDSIYLEDQKASLARKAALNASLPQGINGNGYTVDSLLYHKDGTCGTWQDFAVKLCAYQGLDCDGFGIMILPQYGNAFKVNPNLTGQGGGIPLENSWGDHALIRYNGNVYDPSYGVCYGSYDNYKASFVLNVNSVGNTDNRSYWSYGHTYTPSSFTVILGSYFVDTLEFHV